MSGRVVGPGAASRQAEQSVEVEQVELTVMSVDASVVRSMLDEAIVATVKVVARGGGYSLYYDEPITTAPRVGDPVSIVVRKGGD